MNTKRIEIVLVALLFLVVIPQAVQATTINACTADKATYQQGDNGFFTVTVFNDEAENIRVTQLNVTIDYFYTGGAVYTQTFNTNASLPVEIDIWQSATFYVPFILPTNVAAGYMRPAVKAATEIWDGAYLTWDPSVTAAYQTVVYVESPYKQQFEQQQLVNQQLQAQLAAQQTTSQQQQSQITTQQDNINLLNRQVNDLQTTNDTNTMAVYVLTATTIVFAALGIFVFMMAKKARPLH